MYYFIIMKLYKFLDYCIKLNNLEELLSLLLRNYKIFDFIKKLDPKLNNELFLFKIYSDTENESNIILMYRLLENKFYDLIKKKASRNFKYNDELNNDTSNNKYLVFVTNKKITFDIFKIYLLFYYTNLRLYNNKERYLGIDFEFNTKVVALMQINFEQPNKDLYNTSLIFIFNPSQFSDKWLTFFSEKILCANKVYKILHGSDSLDIPFVYNNLLNANPQLIEKFNQYFIDTKYLCEYHYYIRNLELGKCKIYNVLLNENVINQKKYDELIENEKKMGPIYDIYIQIDMLSEPLIDYTLYDVLYLDHLVKNLKNKIKDFNLIIDITQLVFIDKRNIIEIIPKIEINNINNYIVNIDKPMRLNDLYNNFMIQYLNKNKNINLILKINYFKSTLNFIFKYEFYYYLTKKYDVYEKYNNKIKYNKQLLKLKSNYINKKFILFIINNFKKTLENNNF